MKALIALCVLITSFVSHAGLIKLLDGTVARCNSKVDAARHEISGVYRPVALGSKGNRAVIKIEFLRCTEENDKFTFKRVIDFENHTISPLLSPDRRIQIENKNLELIVANGNGKLVDRVSLKKGSDGLYSGSINLITTQYDNSPVGKKSLVIHIQSIMKITDADNGMIIDEGLRPYGSYRIVVK
ncbi:MAG: hypothetical protein ACLGHN_09635 [Bacteriovoracia bacterium]